MRRESAFFVAFGLKLQGNLGCSEIGIISKWISHLIFYFGIFSVAFYKFILFPMELEFFTQQQRKFNRLHLDFIKKTDLKTTFEILMIEPQSRTVADINTLIKIMLNIEPIKSITNLSATYMICRSMYLARFKQKTFIYQKQEQAECLYIILNGKIGLYRRGKDLEGDDFEDSVEEVVFLSEGNSFGQMYRWKTKFLPLAFQQTLIAIVPKRELNKIAVSVTMQREYMVKVLIKSGIFKQTEETKLREMSNLLTFNRLSHGSWLIKAGQVPKALFYLLKGNVKKTVEMSEENKDLQVTSYSVGDYFPKCSLSQPLAFSLQAECLCQVISIPKKLLKQFGYRPICEVASKNQHYYRSELDRKQDWEQYRRLMVDQLIRVSKRQKQATKLKR